MNGSDITERMDDIIHHLLKNRFDAIVRGESHETPSRLINLTRDMGYFDLANDMAKKLRRMERRAHKRKEQG